MAPCAAARGAGVASLQYYGMSSVLLIVYYYCIISILYYTDTGEDSPLDSRSGRPGEFSSAAGDWLASHRHSTGKYLQLTV